MGADYTPLSQDAEASGSVVYPQNPKRHPSRIYKFLFFLLLSLNVICGILLLFKPPFTYLCTLNEDAINDNQNVTTLPGQSLLKSQQLFSHVGRKLITFNQDRRFMGDPSARDSIWNSLEPAGTGHVAIHDAAKWNLSGGFPLPPEFGFEDGAEEYTLSVYHQLHCLALIRVELMRQDMRLPTPKYAHDNENHVPHCFEYIRQSIMCAADTTLEKSRIEDGKISRDVDGWGVEHECRDWDAVYQWSAKNRSDNTTLIVPPFLGLYAGLEDDEPPP